MLFQNQDAYNPYDRNRYNDDRGLNDGNRYDDRYHNDRNHYNDRNPYSNDPGYNRQNNEPGYNRPSNERYPDRNRPNDYDPNNPNSNYNNDNYDDRNRYSSEDNERHRLELERKNRIEDANLRRALDDVDKLASTECFNNVAAQWNFETNVNDVTQQESVNILFRKHFVFIINIVLVMGIDLNSFTYYTKRRNQINGKSRKKNRNSGVQNDIDTKIREKINSITEWCAYKVAKPFCIVIWRR